jgi:hypothetical protein
VIVGTSSGAADVWTDGEEFSSCSEPDDTEVVDVRTGNEELNSCSGRGGTADGITYPDGGGEGRGGKMS